MSLPSLSAEIPTRSLSRVSLSHSLTDIQWGGESVANVEHAKAIKAGEKMPFGDIVVCNIGNP